MDTGYERKRSDQAYLTLLEEARILRKVSDQEARRMRRMFFIAGKLAGREWNEFATRQTTDEGVAKAARLMVQYRILLADIRHREASNGNAVR